MALPKFLHPKEHFLPSSWWCINTAMTYLKLVFKLVLKYPWHLGSISLFFALSICWCFSWHPDITELFCTAGTDVCKYKQLKTRYLLCLQLCIHIILECDKHEMCKIFQLAQKIPMIASNVTEFKVISFTLALKSQLLLLVTFFFSCQQESFCHSLVGLISLMSTVYYLIPV